MEEKLNKNSLKEIVAVYYDFKDLIEQRTEEFKELGRSGNSVRIFQELTFCLMTPQSKARMCWESAEKMKDSNTLLSGNPEELQEHMKGVRFKYRKSEFIVEARKKFFSKDDSLYRKIKNSRNSKPLRKHLIDNVKGLGCKESSHFLRNIGKGDNLAILDRHILRNLKELNIIEELPKSCSGSIYFSIEEKMINLSETINIPLVHLDLAMWAKETGDVFK